MNWLEKQRDALLAWYRSRNEREQLILRWGAVAAAVLIVLALVVPLQQKVSATRERLEAKRQDLQWLQRAAPMLAAAGPLAPPPDSQESLVVLIDRSARESGLAQAVTGSQPSGQGGQRVQFEKAEFNLLVAWLARLTSQHGLQVESANFDATAEAGIVNAAVVLRLRS